MNVSVSVSRLTVRNRQDKIQHTVKQKRSLLESNSLTTFRLRSIKVCLRRYSDTIPKRECDSPNGTPFAVVSEIRYNGGKRLDKIYR